ncbi:MAG: response regulator, partial [Oligoflexales bacterium]|nr:response regulator [Oligoflexales bacterium]
ESMYKRNPDDNETRIAFHNSNRLYRLVNQLLDFQKLSAGKMELKRSRIEIVSFLRSCLEHFGPSCSSKNVRLDISIENKGDIFIKGQIDALEKVAFNILSNALKYSPCGGVIKVDLKETKDTVVITVKDNGPGISKENQEKLFKIFSQVDDSTRREYEGTGLGLALVKELTGAMDGDVFVESSEGQGALFGIKFKKIEENEIAGDLPVANQSDYQPKKWLLGGVNLETDDEKVDESKERLTGDGKLIIIIDDLKDMRDLIAKTLVSNGYRHITARDGEEGYQKIIEFKPDLAVIDWMMPKMSGPEVIEKMMDNPNVRSIPTILLTAKSDEESRIAGIKKGAHAYLGKPFNEIELLTTIENLIHLKESEEKVRELNRNLTENVLKRFLPHKLVNEIASGKKVLNDEPRSMDITILFCDLVNFTSKAEDIGSHLSSVILNEYFNKMTKIIFRHDGTIDKFMGDGIMVIFGAPEIQFSEAQVTNAIGCAKAMQAEMKDLNERWNKNHGISFSIRIGIHKGAGIVGSFGGEERSEYTVIGPVVNMASRIERAATPGGIFFSSNVRDCLPSGGWSKAGVFNLKGIGNVPLFKIITDDANNGDEKMAV